MRLLRPIRWCVCTFRRAGFFLRPIRQVFSMQNIGGGYYISTEKPDQNGEIHIEVARSGFTTVSASTSFPTPVPVNFEILNDSIEHWLWRWMFWDDDNDIGHEIPIRYERRRTGVFHIKFSDPPNINNFYRLFFTANHYDEDGVFLGHSYILTPPLLREHLREMAGISIGNDWTWPLYLEFSDELFNGKEFSMKFDFDYWHEEPIRPDTTSIVYQLKDVNERAYQIWESWNRQYESYWRWGSRLSGVGGWTNTRRIEIVVELQSISREFYLYLHSREQNRTSGGFFSEPVPIFNNINGGIGIFAGYTSSVYRFVVTPERHPNAPVRRILFEDFEGVKNFNQTNSATPPASANR